MLGLTVFAVGAEAQTDTTHTRSRMDKGSTGQTTNAQNEQSPNGWTMFNDQMGKEYDLNDDQMRRLREVDARYASEYRALGSNPTTNPGYNALTQRRNNDIRGIMSNDVYSRWEKHYGGMPNSMKGDQRNGNQNGGTSTPKSNTDKQRDNTSRPK